jgi:catechol 2,3-dioxygenase-like lactoylglutathione lyase family enzyme
VHLDHVALATRDAPSALRTLVGDLGATVVSGGQSLGFRPMQVYLGDATGGMKVELLEPWEIEHNDFLERFLARHGDGPHHLTFKVDDLAATLADVEAAGIIPVGVNLDDPMWREAFLQPTDAHGTVVQLAESSSPIKLPAGEYAWAVEHGQGGEPVWWPDVTRATDGTWFLRRVVMATPDVGATLDLFAGLLAGERVDEGEGWVELAWASGARVRFEQRADDRRGIDRLEVEGPGGPCDLTVAGARLRVL